MYLSLMGTSNILAPVLAIISIPGSDSSPLSSIPFCTMYLNDPYTLPSTSASDEDPRPTKMEMLLFAAETAYQAHS